ncbi:hypothetical protein KUCAC02_011384 [Chaenocephalus aceratus]|uniref:Uncharacterized protein n=1 Tax=Chaenocephalus aceratus TaxID=36190 RepID=A0ACB9WX64_CHAAC|nr:hypothetical protein KUCAC02_011384 [Chaenocephalus aceratus]
MENAIQDLVKVFLKSTKGKESLGKNQFQNLVKNQLSNVLSDTESKEAVNNMAQGLDANQDGKKRWRKPSRSWLKLWRKKIEEAIS